MNYYKEKKIPIVDNSKLSESRIPSVEPKLGLDERILFSFAAIQRNEYFNLDGTCINWASDLFSTLEEASKIKLKDIYAGKYSGKNSTLRIHSHKNVKNPCKMPLNVNLEDMWQIRISKSKGGVHGIFYENVFYLIWFDPQHNLYPDDNHGGLKKITPPSTCCKEREIELEQLKAENDQLKNNVKTYEELLELK